MEPKKGSPILKRCPLCGGQDYRLLWATPDYGLWACRRCGLVRRELRQESARPYLTESYFAGYLREREKFAAIFRRLMDAVECYRRPPGRLLDAGCGVGLLLEEARARGWEVVGIELAPWAAQGAREAGLKVFTGDLLEVAAAPSPFDVAIINHVLEHLEEPLLALRCLHGWLKEGSLLAVGVPNFGSPMAQIEREHWPALQPLEHLWQFTPTTMARLLRAAGFEPFHRQTEMQPRNYQRTLKDLMKRGLYFAAARLNKGETMLVLAEKPK